MLAASRLPGHVCPDRGKRWHQQPLLHGREGLRVSTLGSPRGETPRQSDVEALSAALSSSALVYGTLDGHFGRATVRMGV